MHAIEVELRLRDASGNQATSDTFTLMFRNVECTLAGDVDGDGEVTDVDLDAFYGILVDPASVTHEARCAADLNLDGFATADDEDLLLSEVGLEETPIRGDANGSQLVDLSDAVSVLSYLYLGGEEPVSFVYLPDPSPTTRAFLDFMSARVKARGVPHYDPSEGIWV